MKTCVVCLNRFIPKYNNSKACSDECIRILSNLRRKRWRLEHPEEAKLCHKKYYQEHKAEEAERHKRFKLNNPKYAVNYAKKWRLENLIQWKKNHKRCQLKHKEKYAKTERKWLKKRREELHESYIRKKHHLPKNIDPSIIDTYRELMRLRRLIRKHKQQTKGGHNDTTETTAGHQ